MKRFLGIILISILAISCKNDINRTDYVINGKAEGVYNGIRVYLSTTDSSGRQVRVDKAIIMNEKFKLTGKLKYPKLHFITIDGIKGILPFMLENNIISLEIDEKEFEKSVINGSLTNEKYNFFNSSMTKLNSELKKATDSLNSLKSMGYDELALLMQKKVKKLNLEVSEFPYSFIENNKDDYAMIPVLETLARFRFLDRNRIFKFYNSLDENLKQAARANGSGIQIENFIARLKAEKATAIGAIAPEFSAPSPTGEVIALSDVIKKGKVTIIDFWAAWCGPCRRENPNIVKVYEKYHSKGLEIIGVGLDGRRGQSNPKEAWIKAINDDNLTWHQISNLKYFDNIAQSYNVNSIPSMFVLNDKGEIIAKNLRGVNLENKIAELLD